MCRLCNLSEFHHPQLSEEDAYLPTWLQQCNVEPMNLGEMCKDHITFVQRIEECISEGESLREGGCDIGPLYISGTDSSPFSFVRASDNVVQFHLCLSSDGNSQHTAPADEARHTDSNCHLVSQPLETTGVLCHKDVNVNLAGNACTVNCSSTLELERTLKKNELLKQDETVNFSDAAADAVELCIEASEALVINEVIESTPFAKPSSASAILEASLQVKQARLEVWTNTFTDSTHMISEMDNLSDLDDITMESAFEDAGIQFNELPGNELSVSQVKDTFESEYGESLNHEKAGASTTIFGKSCNISYMGRMECVLDNDIQVQKDLAAECFNGDTHQMEIDYPVCGLGTAVEYFSDCLRTVDTQKKLDLSVLAEKRNAPMAEKDFHETDVISSPNMSFRDGGKDLVPPNMAKEQFQSRWLGGWTSNDEVKHFTTVKQRIPEPFAAETSFLSESANTALDQNSVVQNHDKEAIVASQLSTPSENFSNRAKDGMLLSQDVRSSSSSLVDSLCSVVPCSISENCSSPDINHEETACPGYIDLRIECENGNMLGTFPSNNSLAQAETIAVPIANIKESQNEVSRWFTSLSNYSKLLTSNRDLFNGNQKKSCLIDNTDLTVQETPFTNCKETVEVGAELSVLQKDDSLTCSVAVNRTNQHHFQDTRVSMDNCPENNPTGTSVLLKSKIKCHPSENLQWKLSECKNQSAKKLLTSKRVRFSEQETSIPDNSKLQKMQTAPETCCSTRAASKSARFSEKLESRAQLVDRSLKRHLDKKKKRLIFQNMEFLLTGFSKQKEKEIEDLIRKYGGIVLSQIPSTNLKGRRSSRFNSRALPVVLCLKKIQSFKFLYGCALNAHVLKINWLIDSIAAGIVLPPKRYMILSRNIIGENDLSYTAVNYNGGSLVFNNLGVMVHGKTKYFTNIAAIIKHGGGQVFQSLQRLVQTLEAGKISTGVVVTDEESRASRHLKQCASEQNIPMMSIYWIIKSLYAGRLILLDEKKNSRCKQATKLQRHQDNMELMSQEI